MSEHVEHEHLGNWRVPFFANRPVEVARPAKRDDGGNHWGLAAVIVGSTMALYVAAIGAIYLALAAVL